jgi:hypothetical protein
MFITPRPTPPNRNHDVQRIERLLLRGLLLWRHLRQGLLLQGHLLRLIVHRA